MAALTFFFFPPQRAIARESSRPVEVGLAGAAVQEVGDGEHVLAAARRDLLEEGRQVGRVGAARAADAAARELRCTSARGRRTLDLDRAVRRDRGP